MKLPLSLVQGPGSHFDLIYQYLDQHFDTFDSYKYWPYFELTRKINGNCKSIRSRSFDFATYVLYGLNNRISSYNDGIQLHKEYLNGYYDSICSSYLDRPKSLIACVQTSLKAIKKNKKLGGKTILEHPMTHVDNWMSVNEEFYKNPSIKIKPGYSHFTKGIVARMKKEYEIADYIQVHSSFAKETFVRAGIPESKLMRCLLGVNLEMFPRRDNMREKQKQFTILFVGRLELLKGVHLLLETLNKMNNPEIELVLVGRIMPEIKPYLDAYPKNVRIIQPMNRSELSKVYGLADVLVFPSLNDAFGMVILEAMAHGLPVIGSTSSAAPDIITNKVNGLIINSGDKMSLEEAIVWSINNRSKLMEMGAKAKMVVEKEFSAAHYFDRLQNNLKQVNFIE